jgi:hypothetical protein
MAIQIEIVSIAAMVAIGLIVLAGAIATGIGISRRRAHHLAEQTGSSPMPPAVDVRPPE